jgi:hypothetical protein
MKRLLAVGIWLLLTASDLFACQCMVLPTLTKQFAETYDIIFVGQVVAISPGDVESTARFKVLTLYHGQCYPQIDVQYDNEGDCGLNFVPGETWVVYGKWKEYNIQERVGIPRADWCMHTRKKMNAGEQDYYMTEGRMSYDLELKLLDDSLGVRPFLDPTETRNQLHTNELPGAGTAFGYLAAGLLGLAAIFFFVRRLFKRDVK